MKKGMSIMVLVMCFGMASAQTDNPMQEAYEAFREKAKGDYQEFRRQCNEQYAKFMERAWQLYQGRVPIPMPKDENPIPPVRFEEDMSVMKDRQLLIDKVVPPLFPVLEQPAPVAPIKEQPQPTEGHFSFRFYGTELSVRLDDSHRFKMADATEQSVAQAWRVCSESRFDNVVRDCLTLRLKYALGDWAYLRMLQELGDAFMGRGTNESVLLAAYLYCQSGYKMRVGRMENNRLCMLVATNHLIYDRGYYEIDGDNYYPVTSAANSLRVCNAAFPGEQAMSLWMAHDVKLAMNATQPRLLQSERYPDMKLSVTSNRNLIDFFNDYPSSQIGDDYMTKWAIYANTPLLKEVADGLYPPLRQAIGDKSQLDAANRLLNFVQTAFVYEYDDKVWGMDRTFFAEETIYYPYCDCEDRSVLFSRLIRDLMGLDVVLVYYPGHLATAVHFTEEVAGDFLLVNGRRFVVCDPTFINAPVGQTMPGMDNRQATVILLEK